MSTFWNLVEEAIEPTSCMIRFRCSVDSTSDQLAEVILEALLRTSSACNPRTTRFQDEASKREVEKRTNGDEGYHVAFPDGDYVLLMLDDAHLLPDATASAGSLWETLRCVII